MTTGRRGLRHEARPRKGREYLPGDVAHHSTFPTSLFLRRERPHRRTRPAVGVVPSPSEGPTVAPIGPLPPRRPARTTMGTLAPGPSRPTRRRPDVRATPRVRPAGKESVRHDHRYLARRPDRHDGRRFHKATPCSSTSTPPGAAPADRCARRSRSWSRRAIPSSPIDIDRSAEVKRSLSGQGRPNLRHRRLQRQGASPRPREPMPAAQLATFYNESQAQGRVLDPRRSRRPRSEANVEDVPARRRADSNAPGSISAPMVNPEALADGRPDQDAPLRAASGASARARSSTARPRSRSSSPVLTSSGSRTISSQRPKISGCRSPLTCSTASSSPASPRP